MSFDSRRSEGQVEKTAGAAVTHSTNGGAPPLRSAAGSIIFINRFFYPDHSATSQILSDLAFHLAASGHSVQVITSRQRYDNPGADLPATEVFRGVAIHRLSTTRFGRTGLLGRGFDYLSFYMLAWRLVLRLSAPGDILVAKTDPPLLCLPAFHAARGRGLYLINWLQDLYPEVAAELGVPVVNGWIGRFLARLRDRTLRAAAANVVVGQRMAEIVGARGVPAERIQAIPNWCDDDEIAPVQHAENPLRREWQLEDRFVIGYSGNLGRAHEFQTILAAAEQLRDEAQTLFLLIGGGSGITELAREVQQRKLDKLFCFRPYQDRAVLNYSLGVADMHWVSLRPEVEGLIVPSKFYGIAAAGRPIITITARDGELARLVREHSCGVVVEPGDGTGLAEILRRLRAEPEVTAEMGRRARTMLDARFTRRASLAAWARLVEAIQSGSGLDRNRTNPAVGVSVAADAPRVLDRIRP